MSTFTRTEEEQNTLIEGNGDQLEARVSRLEITLSDVIGSIPQQRVSEQFCLQTDQVDHQWSQGRAWNSGIHNYFDEQAGVPQFVHQHEGGWRESGGDSNCLYSFGLPDRAHEVFPWQLEPVLCSTQSVVLIQNSGVSACQIQYQDESPIVCGPYSDPRFLDEGDCTSTWKEEDWLTQELQEPEEEGIAALVESQQSLRDSLDSNNIRILGMQHLCVEQGLGISAMTRQVAIIADGSSWHLPLLHSYGVLSARKVVKKRQEPR